MKMSANSTNARPAEIKREEFRKYLEHSGVFEILTNALIKLYEEPERPANGIEYFRKFFMNSTAEEDNKKDVETLKQQLEEANAQIADLERRLSEAKQTNPNQ